MLLNVIILVLQDINNEFLSSIFFFEKNLNFEKSFNICKTSFYVRSNSFISFIPTVRIFRSETGNDKLVTPNYFQNCLFCRLYEITARFVPINHGFSKNTLCLFLIICMIILLFPTISDLVDLMAWRVSSYFPLAFLLFLAPAGQSFTLT